MKRNLNTAHFEDLEMWGEKLKALSSLMVDTEGGEYEQTRHLGYLLCDMVIQYFKSVKELKSLVLKSRKRGKPKKMRYDDIISDLYGPHEKLQAIGETMIDGAHELDVNITGLGAIVMDIYKEYDEVIQKYKVPFHPLKDET